MRIGILALQGDVAEHAAALEEVGATARPVRRPADLDGLAGIILPGGESTTLSMLLESSGLFEPLRQAMAGGLPALGTCAGMVLLATRVLDGRPDQRSFGALDCTLRRNGYGRQLDSFETTLRAAALSAELGVDDGPLPAVFIRAPVVESVGPAVEVLASVERNGASTPAICRQGAVLATAFHPELTGDRRVHRVFVEGVVARPSVGS
ncbi:MAG TPA: pyridoxal 5'-phosphate synthase glutaminase subunit PdxT [Acidimicrobiales bacterium]|nr:pyridoxal 5'-phosphate synthase glutaminase subunit PdxT [Acidimicrobiales bacterium]